MGMDLVGRGGYFRWGYPEWAEVLDLGLEFGWQPLGAGPPRGYPKSKWDGDNYFGNDGQYFYARDARALADALERALVAQRKAAPKKPKRKERANVQVEAADIRKFIRFCRAGGFRLY